MLRRHRSAGGASPSWATRRSTTRLRIPTAATAATSVNASRPMPRPTRYQSRNPSTIASTAASRAAGPRSASNTAAAAALRCTGPIVSCGRSGPHTVSGRRSSAVLPTCTSRAGPAGSSCTGRAPTVITCPNATTSRPGVSAIVVGMPATRQNATSATVGQWRRAARRLRRSYRAGPLLLRRAVRRPACAAQCRRRKGSRSVHVAPLAPTFAPAAAPDVRSAKLRGSLREARGPPATRRRRSSDRREALDGVADGRDHLPGRAPGHARRSREQPLGPELLLAAPSFGDAVGVQQQRVARRRGGGG